MQKISLLNIDASVSQLVFGCWGITSDFHWGTRDESDSIAAIHAAIDAGVNFFDTAEMYGEGNSETLLGKALADRRDQVIIATKMRPDSMRPEDIRVGIDRSLQRLGTDYIDLYQTHWTNPDVSIADTWGAMLRLKEQGKVRSVGVCNAGLKDLAEISAIEPPVTNQLPYNLLWRAIEHEILPYCRDHQVGVLAYSPLMHGLLSGKFKTAADVPDGRARSRHFTTERALARHGERGCEGETFAAIEAIRRTAGELGRPMADVALAWVAAQPGITCVIAGARTPEQLAANIATLQNPLPEDAIEKLDFASQAVNQALGSNPDMWQGSGKGRFR
jgi:aryl-alcohol dehydrogenase-like predicted oxidoreductase